jgi:hypothetical protein
MISLVQKTMGVEATASNSFAWSYASNVTKGNLLLVCAAFAVSGAVPSVTDSQGNTWTQFGTTVFVTNAGNTAVFWAIAKNSAACTVTLATTSSAARHHVDLREFAATGGWPANPSDTIVAANSQSATPAVNITPGVPSAALVSFFAGNNQPQTPIAGTGWLDAQNLNGALVFASCDRFNAAQGVQLTASFSGVVSNTIWNIRAFSFYERATQVAIII